MCIGITPTNFWSLQMHPSYMAVFIPVSLECYSNALNYAVVSAASNSIGLYEYNEAQHVPRKLNQTPR